MAYRMEYGMTSPQMRAVAKPKKMIKRNPKLWIALALVIVAVIFFTSTDFWIPGDAEVTKNAVDRLVQDVKDGEQVVDAFATFCKTVLEGG